MNVAIPLLSSAISLAFALTVLDQYLERRKPYQLVWTVGLFIYFVATGCEFLAGALGLTEGQPFSEVVFRSWYLLGAVFVAAYLGMGTVYLLAPGRAANIVMLVLLVASVFAAVRVFTASTDLTVLKAGETLTAKGVLPTSVRLITPFFNIFGTVTLVGGALYSAWVFWRKRVMPHRVLSNILIAVGAFMPAMGGTFARFNIPGLLYLSEMVGIIVIFLGFLRSREVFEVYRVPFLRRRGEVSKA